MPAMNQTTRYGGVSQLLHWTTALLVLVLLVLGKAGLLDAEHAGTVEYMWHGSLGVLVLALAAARLLWLLVSPAPDLPATMTRLGRMAARTVHVSFYVLLIALPLSGWLAASSEGNSINFFNIAALPHWPGAGAMEDLAKELHELLGDALLVLVSLHVLAALKHQFVDHDALIRRMLPPSGHRPGR